MNIKKRNYNLDLLRILACFMVIMIHVCATNWYVTKPDSFEFIVYTIFDSATRSAVPLFIMISGIYFLNKDMMSIKKLYLKNILKLIVFYIVWNLIYYVADLIILNQSFNSIELFNRLVLGHYHLWFIPMIIGLYILSPLLSKITVHSDKKLVKYFVVLFLISSIIFTIDHFNFLPKYELIHKVISILPIKIICQYYSYFLLGYFLYNYDFKFLKGKNKILIIIYVFSFLVCSILTWYISHSSGINTEYFYNNFSIFTLLEAICIFLIFKDTKFISESIYSSKIENLAKDAFGIYGVHALIIFALHHYEIITIADFNPLLSVPVMSVITFLGSLFIVLLLKKIKFLKNLC